VCQGIIKHGIDLPHVQHMMAAGAVSKAELLRRFGREYRRQDITITPTEAKTVIDRTLATLNDSLNRQLWAAAGYAKPPTPAEMVAELARFRYHFAREIHK
jgi:hypothetical protein